MSATYVVSERGRPREHATRPKSDGASWRLIAIV